MFIVNLKEILEDAASKNEWANVNSILLGIKQYEYQSKI